MPDVGTPQEKPWAADARRGWGKLPGNKKERKTTPIDRRGGGGTPGAGAPEPHLWGRAWGEEEGGRLPSPLLPHRRYAAGGLCSRALRAPTMACTCLQRVVWTAARVRVAVCRGTPRPTSWALVES